MPGPEKVVKKEAQMEAPVRPKLIDVKRTVEKLLEVKAGELKLIEEKEDYTVIGTVVNDNFVRLTYIVTPSSVGAAVQGLNEENKLVTEFKAIDAEILKHIIWL